MKRIKIGADSNDNRLSLLPIFRLELACAMEIKQFLRAELYNVVI